MQCTGCGTELLPGKRFCHACGTPAPLLCPQCGASVAPEFRFCPDCGAEIGAPAAAGAPVPAGGRPARVRHIPEGLARKVRAAQEVSAGERKQATVLFCDLAGSTAIGERLDPEEYHDLLDEYLELAFREIYRFEGIVTHSAGDGMMALFGAPVAHEDAPGRAVRAALAIREALERLNERLRARGLELGARIGIHTGPVVVGTVGNDLKMDYTAIGDTTNLASRLESLAVPGTILVSEATHRLVRGFFRVRPTGPLAVRGKSEPVAAYEVLGETPAASSMTIAAARGLTPLVGREEELAQLASCYRRLGGGLAQVVTVVGEAGLGKSRLVYEFKQRLADESVVCLEGRCSSLGQGVPYSPFGDMLKRYFGLTPGESPADACAKVQARLGPQGEAAERSYAALCQLLATPVSAPATASTDEAKREAFDATARLLLSESQRAPVIVLIEDLHWLDDASRELLENLLARLDGARLMVLLTHRPDDRAAWRTRAALTQLVLRRLTDAEVREVMRGVAGGALPDSLERLVVAKADGSPFCAEEITRSLIEEGYLAVEGGPRLTRPVEEIRIPGTVQEVLAARLDRLGADAKRVVQVAAVLGRQFPREQLARLLADEPIDVSAELAELERRGIFHRKHVLAGDDYRFGESLTQEVAYESLLLKQRRQLHERIALSIEAEPGESTAGRAALLAHHFARSDNRRKAVEALLRAAEEAERLPSYGTAVDLYRRTWELAEAAITDDGAELYRHAALRATRGLAGLAVLVGQPGVVEADRAARRGRELAEALGDTESLAMLCASHGVLTMFGERDGFERGLELSERGMAIAQQGGLELTGIRIARGLAINYALDGRFEAAHRAIGWVMERIEGTSHHTELSDLYVSARWVRDNVLLLSDELDTVCATAAETHAMALRSPNRTVTCGAASVLAQVHFLRGQYAEALHWANASLEVGEAIGNVAGFPTPAAIALAARVELGQPAGAERYLDLIDQGLATGRSLQSSFRFVTDGLFAIGDLERAERLAESLRADGRSIGRLRRTFVDITVGEAMLRLGRLVEAERAFTEALGLAEAIGARSSLAVLSLRAAELAALRGDPLERERQLARAVAAARALRLGRILAQADQLADRSRAAESA